MIINTRMMRVNLGLQKPMISLETIALIEMSEIYSHAHSSRTISYHLDPLFNNQDPMFKKNIIITGKNTP